ncbi:hypothetical protein MPNT_80022 [Candidatus Methylacidithermus pantelleriae]|uniref:Uncharacterized protein n=1 Tax=Candidatus Methylacidithermus pantelleriae TaxID=2744239 RepID=A0A8J2BQY9_9BACT|nr:hypothetical protein MPNT_80022 [Candidatus Methylacidithermus pantelleriae]
MNPKIFAPSWPRKRVPASRPEKWTNDGDPTDHLIPGGYEVQFTENSWRGCPGIVARDIVCPL